MASNALNPFFSGINIPDKYFCDRVSETKSILETLENGSNIVMKSPRRIGKSSLIKHIFSQKEVKKKYNTFFVDVFGTKSMDDFTREFGREFMRSSSAKRLSGRKGLLRMMQNPYAQINLSPDGALSGFRVGLDGGVSPVVSLPEIMETLEKSRKPNIVAFDEFQTIQEYPEKAAAILRGYIQQMNNTRFIFAGSSRHMLNRMFEQYNEPFYHSSSSFNLGLISMDAYVQYCREMFELFGKQIDSETVNFVYELFSGITYDMQKVMHETFFLTRRKGIATISTVKDALAEILSSYDQDFRAAFDQLQNQREKNLLVYVALQGQASGLTSAATLKRFNLDNASAVQNALKHLCSDESNLLVKFGKASYKLNDKFFELWIADQYGILESKYNAALSQFKGDPE